MNEVINIPDGWVETTLGEVCSKIGSGSTPTGGNEAYKKSGISLVRSQNIHDFNFSYNGLAFIDDEQAKKLSSVTLEIKDVLLNITGDSVARSCMLPDEVLPARVNQHVAILRANTVKIDNYYLKYLILNPICKSHLLMIASSGATRNALTKTMLEKLDIILPSLHEQKSIAAILTTFDNKIELLQAQNKTLEATAQTIFAEWFGKYSVDDELPDGWRVGKLSEIGKIICGKTPSKSNEDYFGNDIPFIKIPDMHNKMFILETTDNLSLEGAMSQNNKMLPKDSICISCIATVGLVSITTKNSQTNQQINSIIPNEIYLREFLYFTLTKMKNYLNDLGSGGTATLNVNTSSFSNIELVIPKEDVVKDFHKLSNPIFKKVLKNNIQIQTLTKTRDEILPRLMSGEVRVSEL